MRDRRFVPVVMVTVVTALAGAGAVAIAPAHAIGSASITDSSGVDYDAACVAQYPTVTPAPNSIASPFGAGCPGVSRYDGSTEGTDLVSVSLASSQPPTGLGRFTATVTISQTIPPAGWANRNALDLPTTDFLGATYYVMFQNKTLQTNVDTGFGGGCARRYGFTPVYDQPGSWRDGFHFFVAFSVRWDGLKWIHSAQIGEYDPSPTGGFVVTALATDDGTGWKWVDWGAVIGADWTVSVSGATATVAVDAIVDQLSSFCNFPTYPVFRRVYGRPGNVIANVKGLSTANMSATLPVTVPVATLCTPSGGTVCDADVWAVGGFAVYSDTTAGASTAGVFGTNISGVAYTSGPLHNLRAGGEWVDTLVDVERQTDGHRGIVHLPDTLGPDPTCPTPTMGGLLPSNVLFLPDTACHIDDDLAAKGSFLPEFWDTPFGFTF